VTTLLHFDRFRLDRANQQLEDAAGPIRLSPKAFAVLKALIARPGQLVLKDQLLDEVWPDISVSDGVLKLAVAEVRKALGDSATQPRFVETVHRRGYRFLASVAAEPAKAFPARAGSLVAWPPGAPGANRSPVGVVGRGPEMALLEEHLARAFRGERRVVFVTGEPGAGKTALVEHFIAEAAGRVRVAVTGGQCLEQYGSGEAYMPVLEAIGRLVREDAASRRLLRRYAPTWLAQLPWLREEEDPEHLEREILGAARDRMLREMGEFVEALSAEIPLVLILEDLHWSDPSTVDLVSLLAARREAARLLLIGTYRPVELILGRHPLRSASQTLMASRRCEDIALDELGAEAVAEYLERRFPGGAVASEAAAPLRERTDGNPLFLVTIVDHLIARGAVVERNGVWQVAKGLPDELRVVPESLRLLIEEQLHRVPSEDRELLEGASLVGVDFSAPAAAAATERATPDAESRCALLVGAGRILSSGGRAIWPDGTVAERFAFRHSLYREALAAALHPRRRSGMHRRIGRALETAFGERSSEIAAELALHFEEGGDRARALRYRRSAAETAARRFAFVEAQAHLDEALASLRALPETRDRDRDELSLQSMIATVRQATQGYAAPEVATAFARALELVDGTPQDASAFPVLHGIWTFYTVTGELDRAVELAERNRSIAETSGDRLMRLIAHQGLWTTHFFRGEFTAALRHLDEGEPLYDPVADRRCALVYGTDPKTGALSYRSLLLWELGAVDQATAHARHAVDHARALGHPLSLGRAMVFAAWLRHCRREVDACRDETDAALAYCTEQRLPFWMPHCLGLRGWVLTETGEVERGIADLEKGLALWKALGASCGRSPNDRTLTGAYARAGRLVEARALLERSRAIIEAGERFHEAETHCVDAELVLAEAGGADRAPTAARARAEVLLDAAIACASRQGARTLELRATTMLARHCRRGKKREQARTRLAELLSCFTEGLGTPDLRDARRLLQH
jgi:DNA-binding winged helix-turn-helix (wHTH) protein/tetratricopeptide (TPR) repeat protein